jgi:hypothetical protein
MSSLGRHRASVAIEGEGGGGVLPRRHSNSATSVVRNSTFCISAFQIKFVFDGRVECFMKMNVYSFQEMADMNM